jgi:polysaccharide chain length determinant protein (PEP-CTERM system associated)
MLPGKAPSISDIIGMVRRRLLLLIIPPFVTLFIALVYSASLPNIYQSSVLMAIVPQRVPGDFVQTTVTLKAEERLDAITTQIKSRTNLEQVILEFNLYPEQRRRGAMEDVVLAMRDNIDVALEAPRRGPRGFEPPHAFNVHFTYPDPIVATKVADRLASMFTDQNTRDRSAIAEQTKRFLDDQLAEARTQLEAQEARVEAFRVRYGKSLPTQTQSNMQAIQGANMQIQATVDAIARDRDRKTMLERLYAEAQQEPVLVAPTPTTPQSPAQIVTTGSARERLAANRQALAQLQLRLKPDHPDIVRANRMIAELEAKAAEEEAAAVAAGGEAAPPVTTTNALELQRRERLRNQRAEIESLDRLTAFKEAEERRLRALVADYQQRLELVPGVESEWAAVSRDYDTQLAQYKDLLAKSDAAKVAVDLEARNIGEQFRPIDRAKVPERPISPVRMTISGAGFGAGLALGFLIAALLELRDRSYRNESDVLDVLRLPVLATTPLVLAAEERTRRLRLRLIFSGVGAGVAAAAGYAFFAMNLWSYLI